MIPDFNHNGKEDAGDFYIFEKYIINNNDNTDSPTRTRISNKRGNTSSSLPKWMPEEVYFIILTVLSWGIFILCLVFGIKYHDYNFFFFLICLVAGFLGGVTFAYDLESLIKCKAKTTERIVITFTILSIVLSIFPFFLIPYLESDSYKEKRIKKGYERIWVYIDEGEYRLARKEISDIWNYYCDINNNSDGIQDLEVFCYACKYFDEGDYESAYFRLDSIEQNASDDIAITVEQYNIYKMKKSQIEEAYIAQNTEEASAKATSYEPEDIPRPGMILEEINETSLGKYDSSQTDISVVDRNGIERKVDEYYWKDGDMTIFSVRISNGIVVKTFDYRPMYDYVINPGDHTNTSEKSESSSSKKSKSSSSKSSGSGYSRKKNNSSDFDPDDHDIEQYYEDYKDIEGFEDIDDAYDDFEDNPEYWDDY